MTAAFRKMGGVVEAAFLMQRPLFGPVVVERVGDGADHHSEVGVLSGQNCASRQAVATGPPAASNLPGR